MQVSSRVTSGREGYVSRKDRRRWMDVVVKSHRSSVLLVSLCLVTLEASSSTEGKDGGVVCHLREQESERIKGK